MNVATSAHRGDAGLPPQDCWELWRPQSARESRHPGELLQNFVELLTLNMVRSGSSRPQPREGADSPDLNTDLQAQGRARASGLPKIGELMTTGAKPNVSDTGLPICQDEHQPRRPPGIPHAMMSDDFTLKQRMRKAKRSLIYSLQAECAGTWTSSDPTVRRPSESHVISSQHPTAASH
jgi:hypothetical protein